MKLNNYFLPALVAGFAAGVASIVPVLSNLSCCIMIPLASFFAMYLYNRASGRYYIEFRHASAIGILTGITSAVFATFFLVLLSYINKTNDFVDNLPQTEIAIQELELGPIFQQSFELMKHMGKEIKETGFSLFFTIGMLFSNLIVNTVFGFLGAILARNFFNRRTRQE
jgi:hypothetical protein